MAVMQVTVGAARAGVARLRSGLVLCLSPWRAASGRAGWIFIQYLFQPRQHWILGRGWHSALIECRTCMQHKCKALCRISATGFAERQRLRLCFALPCAPPRSAPPRPASFRPAPDSCGGKSSLSWTSQVKRGAGQALPQASPARSPSQ
jgi:hypothetical protein